MASGHERDEDLIGDPRTGFLKLGRPDPRGDSPQEDVVLFGVPSDCGAVGRWGSERGPGAARNMSWSFGSYHPALGTDILEELTIADAGDLDVVADGDPEDFLQTVKSACCDYARNNQVVGLIGGNQLLTLGALRGIVQAKRRPVALLHLSASHGLARSDPDEASSLSHALKEGLLKPRHVLQVGVRGPMSGDLESQDALRAGFERLTVDDVRWDIHGAMETVRSYADEPALYVSCDLSLLDPAACPWVTRPKLGGLSSWETQQLLRALVGSEIVGFDIVGACPRDDDGGLTPMTTMSVMFELLAVIAASRSESRISITAGGMGRTSA